MALRDVKEYYYIMLSQYIEVKEDLADFEQALKDGYITEDKLTDIQQDVLNIKNNLDRIQYIMYLFELPNRKNKKEKYKISNANLEQYFIENNASLKSLTDENASIIAHLRAEIKKYKQEITDNES